MKTSRLIALIALVLFAQHIFASDIGKRFPSEKTIYVDKVTGVLVTVLTSGSANDSKIYQTHPQWTADGKWIIFRSNRGVDKITQAFAINEQSGEIVQLTDGPGLVGSSFNIARKSQRLFFLRGGMGQPTRLIEMNLASLFHDSQAGAMKDAPAYERVVAKLPDDLRESGGFALDVDEKIAYVGMRTTGLRTTGTATPPSSSPPPRIAQVPSKILRVDLASGEFKTILDTPFTMGHVQTNPWVPGEIIYANETGGDAPQRMWFVRDDGSENHALYAETPDEWVTHEVVTGKDEVMFVIIGHLPRLRLKPTGIAVINLRDNQMKIIGQVEDSRSFWHCNGSPDGRWAVGDTFNGNVYLINRKTSETTLLTTDHKMHPDHTHPTFSPDSSRILIQSGLLSDGKNLNLMTVPVPQQKN